jgi:hypothetical protein
MKQALEGGNIIVRKITLHPKNVSAFVTYIPMTEHKAHIDMAPAYPFPKT